MAEKQSTSLAVSQSASLAVDPRVAVACRNTDDVWRLAGAMATVGLCKSQDEGFVRLAFGMELGLSATAALRATYVVDNRVSLYAEYIAGICQSHPEVCEYLEVVESTNEVATYRCKRVGRPELMLSYTIEDARRADLTKKKNWIANPRAMLRARCASEICRAQFADLTAGLYTPDEIEEQAAREWVEPEAKTVITRVETPEIVTKGAPTADPPKAKATDAAAPPAYAGAKTIENLKKALDAATTVTRIDAIAATFESRKAALNELDLDAAMTMFSVARLRIEDAAPTADAAQ